MHTITSKSIERPPSLASSAERARLTDMQITINSAPYDVPEGLTVRGVLDRLKWTEGPVAVEVNRALVPRQQHSTHVVCEGDVLEAVHFVGGG